MELKLNKQPLYPSEVLLDTTVEQPVECDAMLPDDCPDLVRVLRCVMTPVVTAKRLSGNHLEAEGMARLTVYYVAPGEELAKAEFKVPFSRLMEMRGEARSPGVTVTASPGYVNCRGVGQRRLDIRGAVTLTARVIHCRREEAISGGEEPELELKEEQVAAARILGQESREARLEQTLELTYGKPPILRILRWQCCPRVTECRAASGKVSIKGELELRMLYHGTSGEWEQMTFTVPAAAVAEMEGVEEDSLCDCRMEVLSLELEPGEDSQGENRCVILTGMVLFTVRAHGEYQAQVCTDCYSTRHPCRFHTRQYPLMRQARPVREPFPVRQTMPLPENTQQVLELWCELNGWNLHPEEGGSVVEGRLTLCMLARAKEGEILYLDQGATFQQKLPLVLSGGQTDLRLAQDSSDFALTGGSGELRCQLVLEGMIYLTAEQPVIEELEVDEKKPREGLMAPGLYLYLAQEGESLWEIAKRYNTSIRRIQEENPEEEQPGKREVLLVPVV